MPIRQLEMSNLSSNWTVPIFKSIKAPMVLALLLTQVLSAFISEYNSRYSPLEQIAISALIPTLLLPIQEWPRISFSWFTKDIILKVVPLNQMESEKVITYFLQL